MPTERMPVGATTRRFTADEFEQMGRAGILSRRDRVELIDGEIVAMSPIGSRHAAAVDRATRMLVTRVGDAAIVRVQSPVRLNLFTEPEPDLVLLRPRADFYASAHPGPADVLLILEIADSSLDYDRVTKAPLYARMGVPEYWLADVDKRAVTCHSAPSDDAYTQMTHFGRGQVLSPLLLPQCSVMVDDLLAD